MNRDSYEKNATGAKKTGIRRIPAGIGNLASEKGNLRLAKFGMLSHPNLNPSSSLVIFD